MQRDERQEGADGLGLWCSSGDVRFAFSAHRASSAQCLWRGENSILGPALKVMIGRRFFAVAQVFWALHLVENGFAGQQQASKILLGVAIGRWLSFARDKFGVVCICVRQLVVGIL